MVFNNTMVFNGNEDECYVTFIGVVLWTVTKSGVIFVMISDSINMNIFLLYSEYYNF